MMTRSALARQEASKLQMALRELQSAKKLCDEMNKERDDNERELLELISRNKTQKIEMAELHTQLLVVTDARDRLQLVVDGFKNCSLEYENALTRINSLEHQLQEAYTIINNIETAKLNITASLNQSLFDELVCSAPGMVSAAVNTKPMVTIDLTNDSVVTPSTIPKSNCSKNKLKKYVKINNYIKKTQKLVKKHKFFIKNVKLNGERLRLLDTLEMYASKLENNTLQYESDTHNLKCEIDSLEEKLKSIKNKYERSEKQLKEYILAMNEMIKCHSTGNPVYNDNIKNQLSLDHSLPSCSSKIVRTCKNVCQDTTLTSSSQNTNSIPSTIDKPKIVIFSDEIGKDMGHLLSNTSKGHNVINYCTPGLSYQEIMNRIFTYSFSPNTTLLILIGNRGNVNKKQIIDFNNRLSNLTVDNVIMFTFPYSNSLPQVENDIRYKLNLTLYTICNNNFNGDKFNLIDINNYIKKFFLTKDNYYLSNYYKRQIAVSLSYLFDIAAKNLANKVASIEQSNSIDNASIEQFDIFNSANCLATNDIVHNLN